MDQTIYRIIIPAGSGDPRRAEPDSPSEGIMVTFIVENEATVELMEIGQADE